VRQGTRVPLGDDASGWAGAGAGAAAQDLEAAASGGAEQRRRWRPFERLRQRAAETRAPATPRTDPALHAKENSVDPPLPTPPPPRVSLEAAAGESATRPASTAEDPVDAGSPSRFAGTAAGARRLSAGLATSLGQTISAATAGSKALIGQQSPRRDSGGSAIPVPLDLEGMEPRVSATTSSPGAQVRESAPAAAQSASGMVARDQGQKPHNRVSGGDGLMGVDSRPGDPPTSIFLGLQPRADDDEVDEQELP